MESLSDPRTHPNKRAGPETRDPSPIIAVLGVDNDAVICGVTNPPLSSIDLNSRRIVLTAKEAGQPTSGWRCRESRGILFGHKDQHGTGELRS